MAETSSKLGPVELVVLTFPGIRVDAKVRAALSEVVDRGYVTVLDLIYLSKDANGYLTEVEMIDEPLEDIGLAGLAVDARELLNDEDLELAREAMRPGTSALVVVYEQTWARRLADTVGSAGGEVALHVQVPRDNVEAVLAAT
ncbi:DUF6325 family protein [Nocardia inohanensis]|uniref:DUF6325 family protein n=1 Tax=Nocardia inohanensis TaxID=209246 RepID=UPI000831D302|nr:DUF6325 family protein [Nocardia inohanensis]